MDTKRKTGCASLYQRKAAQLVLYGRALGLSHAEAEDVLQDTFIALMNRHPAVDSEHFCVRIYRNRAFNYRRSLWRRLKREWECRRWFEKSRGEDPAEREAMMALERLPREQREVIVLKIWHHYTFKEIGSLLEISANTAAGRYRYGLEKLRHQLCKEAHDQDRRFGESIEWLGATQPFNEG